MKIGKKLLSVAIVLPLFSCGSNNLLNTSYVADATETAAISAAKSNNEFAFDLYNAAANDGENTFIAPFSVTAALAMTYAGSNGQTQGEIASTVHFGDEPMTTHKGFKSLIPQMSAIKEKNGYQLNIANRLWGQSGYPFKQQFLDITNEYYGAGFESIDFISNTEKSRTTINDWVEDKTQEKIKDLIPQGALNSLTRLVLTNAVYFMAQWQFPFNERMTAKESFHTVSNEEIKVQMMKQSKEFGYAADDELGVHVVRIPYVFDYEVAEPRSTSMILIVPEEVNGLKAVEKQMTAQKLDSLLATMERRRVHLSLPKFKIEGDFSLNEALQDLGMNQAFSQDFADFTKMAVFPPEKNLYISKVLHKTFINLDEKGTEAAGATAVIIAERTSMPVGSTVEVKADHPFMFLIRDDATGTILFLGRLTNPQTVSE